MLKTLCNLFLIAFVLVCCACSSKESVVPTIRDVEGSASSRESHGSSNFHKTRSSTVERNAEELPFELEVVDELNDGTHLHVLVGITAKVNWNTRDSVLRMVGLNGGSFVRESYYTLDGQERNVSPIQLSSQPNAYRQLKRGDRLEFSLSFPSEQITDYHVELLWGVEARESAGYVAPQDLALYNIEVKKERQCRGEGCDISYLITGDLFNNGDSLIDTATLGVGFIWKDQGFQEDLPAVSNSIPEAEERIELAQLSLIGGAQKPIRLVLDTPVPESELGEYVPVIRVISYNDAALVSSEN